MDYMNITSAKYIKHPKEDRNISIWATIDGQKMGVALSEDNRHYIEIKRQVDAGELTIEDAD